MSIDDLRIQFADRAKPVGFVAVSLIQRLAEHELAARCVVAEIEPVGDRCGRFRYRALDQAPRRAGIDTADDKIRHTMIVSLNRA